MKKTIATLMLLTLAGCGMIDNSTRTDESIQQKTAFALGTTAEKITIKSRNAELSKVSFLADYNERTYQCYYSTAIGVVSDVVCSPTDGKPMPTSQQCNALLQAAGKC